MASKATQLGPSGRGYHAGDVYSFRTSPATEFSPKETGRHVALKVLGPKGDCVCYAVLDGVFDHHPDLAEVSELPVLRNTRLRWKGDPACCSVRPDWENTLKDFRYVGSLELSRGDADLLDGCRSIGSWSSASSDAEGEWRWRNDRLAYQEEVERAQRALDAQWVAQREQYEKRLKTLTLEKLLEEPSFSRWNAHPPFPPPDFVAAAKAQVRSTILELQALGPTPKETQVRAVLNACVEWFNAKDAEFGRVIETEEREDICKVLEGLAAAAGQRSLIDEIHDWRNW
jgi:hypothetical protein